MRIRDAIDVLEKGGYLCEQYDPNRRKRHTYGVYERTDPKHAARKVGELTGRQFEAIYRETGLYPFKTKATDRGCVYNFYDFANDRR